MTGPIGSWITAFKSIFGSHLMYREGYNRYKPGSFTVRQLGYANLILVTGDKMRDELKKIPEHILSMKAATRMVSNLRFGRVVKAKCRKGPRN